MNKDNIVLPQTMYHLSLNKELNDFFNSEENGYCKKHGISMRYLLTTFLEKMKEKVNNDN